MDWKIALLRLGTTGSTYMLRLWYQSRKEQKLASLQQMGSIREQKKSSRATVEFRAIHVSNSIAFFQSENLNFAGTNSGEKRAVKPRFYTEGTNIT